MDKKQGSLLILNSTIINEGSIFSSDIFIKDGIIERIDKDLSGLKSDEVIDASGLYVVPGMIDDQVHFREPGFTHKETIRNGSMAAVAGGVTSFMDMPNTQPQTLSYDKIEEKMAIAKATSFANYGFYLGASNDNLEAIKSVDKTKVCGVKVFMGSSTGNMLVDNEDVLHKIFKEAPTLIATHCEDEGIIRANLKAYLNNSKDIPLALHPLIRSEEACFKSTKKAIDLANETDARLHVLHISTQKELELFKTEIPIEDRKITNEVCMHHLLFSDNDYEGLGSFIKSNPAVKSKHNQMALQRGLQLGQIDIIASDHAPHTKSEKIGDYINTPSGIPAVQHVFSLLFDLYHDDKIRLIEVVNKTSHNVAKIFNIEKRGFIKEGYYADLVTVDMYDAWLVSQENILYKCAWTPYEGKLIRSKVKNTIVSGKHVYANGKFLVDNAGQPLTYTK